MLTLPLVAAVVGWRVATRLPRDRYARLDSNDYSVHPSAIGRLIEIAVDPAHAAAAALRHARWLVAVAPVAHHGRASQPR